MQVPLLKEMLEAMQIRMVSLEGYEADDLLGTLAKRCEKDGMEVVILSGDRDLLQLASDRVMIRLPRGVMPLIAAVGVWKAGAAFVIVEEDYAPERIAFIREDCGCVCELSRDNLDGILAARD